MKQLADSGLRVRSEIAESSSPKILGEKNMLFSTKTFKHIKTISFWANVFNKDLETLKICVMGSS